MGLVDKWSHVHTFLSREKTRGYDTLRMSNGWIETLLSIEVDILLNRSSCSSDLGFRYELLKIGFLWKQMTLMFFPLLSQRETSGGC